MLLLKPGYSWSEEQEAFDVQIAAGTRALTRSKLASPHLRSSFRILRADNVASSLMADHRSLIGGRKISPLKKGSRIVLYESKVW